MSVNNNISEEVWAAKDRMSAYQSALKAASTNNQGLGKDYNVILLEADKYYVALLDAKNGDNTITTTTNDKFEVNATVDYPTPSPQELDVLMRVAKEYSLNCPDGYKVDFDLVCKKVFNRFNKYPQSEKSIDKIVNTVNIKDVIVREK